MGKHSLSVWFFIGLLLTAYGVLILASAVNQIIVPPAHPVAMAYLHIGVWWGAGMLLFGLLYVVALRPKRRTRDSIFTWRHDHETSRNHNDR